MSREFESLSAWMRTPLKFVSKQDLERQERERETQRQAERDTQVNAVLSLVGPVFWVRSYFCAMCDSHVGGDDSLAVADGVRRKNVSYVELRHIAEARLSRAEQELLFSYLHSTPQWQGRPRARLRRPGGWSFDGPFVVRIDAREKTNVRRKAIRRPWGRD